VTKMFSGKIVQIRNNWRWNIVYFSIMLYKKKTS